MRHTNRSLLAQSSFISLLVVAFAAFTGCGGDDSPAIEGSGGSSGGSSGSSGGSSGSPGSGGSKAGSGGASQSGGQAATSGGTAASGGSGDGGSVEDPDGGGSGGASASGGSTASGGAAATGGKGSGGTPPGPKCGTEYNDNPTCNACMDSKCCNQLKACVPDSPCEKFLACAVDHCPGFNSGCLQLWCSEQAAGAQPVADLIECRKGCTDACPIN